MRGVSALLALGLAAAPVLPAAAAEPAPKSASAPVAEPSPEALALARQAVTNGFPPEQRSAMFRGVTDAMMAQVRAAYLQQFTDAGVRQIIDHYVDDVRSEAMGTLEARIPALFEAIARAYTREFSIDELRQIRDFTATSAGRHYVSRSAALLSDPDVKAENVAYMIAVRSLAEAHKSAFMAELTTYFSKHPDAARKTVQQAAPGD